MTDVIFSEEKPERPKGSLFFIIASFNQDEALFRIKEKSQKSFSKISFESNTFQGWTPREEEITMNVPGKESKIFAYRRKIHRDELPLLKKKCISLEYESKKIDKSVRIIPGYLTSHNVVIGSVADDYHKVYMFGGVYAEVVYKYEQSRLIPFATAPKYFSQKDVLYYFTSLRDYYDRIKNS